MCLLATEMIIGLISPGGSRIKFSHSQLALRKTFAIGIIMRIGRMVLAGDEGINKFDVFHPIYFSGRPPTMRGGNAEKDVSALGGRNRIGIHFSSITSNVYVAQVNILLQYNC